MRLLPPRLSDAELLARVLDSQSGSSTGTEDRETSDGFQVVSSAKEDKPTMGRAFIFSVLLHLICLFLVKTTTPKKLSQKFRDILDSNNP